MGSWFRAALAQKQADFRTLKEGALQSGLKENLGSLAVLQARVRDCRRNLGPSPKPPDKGPTSEFSKSRQEQHELWDDIVAAMKAAEVPWRQHHV